MRGLYEMDAWMGIRLTITLDLASKRGYSQLVYESIVEGEKSQT